MENLDNILSRVEKDNFLEGIPSETELEEHLLNIIPHSIRSYVVSYKMSGNILTVFVSDPVSRQELSLRANELRDLLNTRLGRGAVGRIKARTKTKSS